MFFPEHLCLFRADIVWSPASSRRLAGGRPVEWPGVLLAFCPAVFWLLRRTRQGSALREWRYLAGFILKKATHNTKPIILKSLSFSPRSALCFHGNGAAHQPVSPWLPWLYIMHRPLLHGRKKHLDIYLSSLSRGQGLSLCNPASDTEL